MEDQVQSSFVQRKNEVAAVLRGISKNETCGSNFSFSNSSLIREQSCLAQCLSSRLTQDHAF